jgi:hypothetical protein
MRGPHSGPNSPQAGTQGTSNTQFKRLMQCQMIMASQARGKKRQRWWRPENAETKSRPISPGSTARAGGLEEWTKRELECWLGHASGILFFSCSRVNYGLSSLEIGQKKLKAQVAHASIYPQLPLPTPIFGTDIGTIGYLRSWEFAGN